MSVLLLLLLLLLLLWGLCRAPFMGSAKGKAQLPNAFWNTFDLSTIYGWYKTYIHL